MGSSLEWLLLCVRACARACVCARAETKRTKKLLFFFSFCSSFFPPVLFFSFPICYLCLLTYCIYIFFFLFFFFSATVIFTSSLDALTMQTHSFIQSRVQFSTLATIVCCHRGIRENLGDKAQTHSVWWWNQTRIQRAIIQQSHTPQCTIMPRRWYALKDGRSGPSRPRAERVSVQRNTFFFLVAIM